MKKSMLFNIVSAGCLLCLGAASAFAETDASSVNTLRIGGGSAPMENVFKRIKEPFEKKTGIKLELIDSGPIDAWRDLAADKIDVASAGMQYTAWSKQMDAKSIAALEDPLVKLQRRIIGTDIITVYTHPDTRVESLTKQQVADIFTGKITNWRDVGGPNHPIAVVLGNKVAGLNSQFKTGVLDGADFLEKATRVDTAREMKEIVQKTPGAVSIGTLAQVQDGSVRMIEYPAPMRYIYMMWKFVSPKQKNIDTLFQYLCSMEAKPYVLAYHSTTNKQ